MSQSIQSLLSDATSPRVGSAVCFSESEQINVRIVATAAGDVGAIVNFEGSFDGNDWFEYAVIDLAGAMCVADGYVVETYPHVRANLTAISGSDAKATVFLLPGHQRIK